MAIEIIGSHPGWGWFVLGEGGSLVPRPRFPTAAGGLHHRYVVTVGNLGLGTRQGGGGGGPPG